MTENALSGSNLYQDVVTYAGFGDHRTATQGENQTTEWMAERLDACGFEVGFQSFPVDTFFVHEARLTVDGKPVECFPLWLPQWTGSPPVIAPLGPLGAEGDMLKDRIALIKPSFSFGALPYSYEGNDAVVREVAKAGALAALVISNGPSDGIHAYNAPDGTERWPLPVALVPKREELALVAAAERGVEVSLLLDGSDELQIESRNVIGTMERGSDLIVISTPKSGWFTCAGERGPGVALFLALAQWASQRDSAISYMFDANTGHEVGGTGIRRFVEELAPPLDRVLAWIHLGANIATWGWDETATGLVRRVRPQEYRVVCDSEELLMLLNTALAGLPGLEPRVGRGLGEMRLVIQTGYRGFGVNGGSYRYFHTPDDKPDVATAPELLEPMAAALTRALELLEAKEKW